MSLDPEKVREAIEYRQEVWGAGRDCTDHFIKTAPLAEVAEAWLNPDIEAAARHIATDDGYDFDELSGAARDSVMEGTMSNETIIEPTRPTCSSCGHPIDQAVASQGEYWGGFGGSDGGGFDEEGRYIGPWYNVFWVIESDEATRYTPDGEEFRRLPEEET